MGPKREKPGARDEDKRAAILHGAIDSFVKFGLRRTTMEDVAAAAGLSRKTVYNYVGDKTKLIGEVFAVELERACSAAEARLDFTLAADELVASAEVALFEVAMDRPLIQRVLEAESISLTMGVTSTDQRLNAILSSYWTPILDQLEESGKLRSDVSRHQLMRWIRWVHVMLLSHAATLAEELELTTEMLRLFFAPALLEVGVALQAELP